MTARDDTPTREVGREHCAIQAQNRVPYREITPATRNNTLVLMNTHRGTNKCVCVVPLSHMTTKCSPATLAFGEDAQKFSLGPR